MIKRVDCVIYGRVQMVMFRDFTKRNARQLGIKGIVQNLSDGSVLVVAEGEMVWLEEFILFLKNGPVFARVDFVDTKWGDAVGGYDAFSIVY